MERMFTARLPDAMITEAIEKARYEGRSLNQIVRLLLLRWLANEIRATPPSRRKHDKPGP